MTDPKNLDDLADLLDDDEPELLDDLPELEPDPLPEPEPEPEPEPAPAPAAAERSKRVRRLYFAGADGSAAMLLERRVWGPGHPAGGTLMTPEAPRGMSECSEDAFRALLP